MDDFNNKLHFVASQSVSYSGEASLELKCQLKVPPHLVTKIKDMLIDSVIQECEENPKIKRTIFSGEVRSVQLKEEDKELRNFFEDVLTLQEKQTAGTNTKVIWMARTEEEGKYAIHFNMYQTFNMPAIRLIERSRDIGDNPGPEAKDVIAPVASNHTTQVKNTTDMPDNELTAVVVKSIAKMIKLRDKTRYI